MLRSLAEATQNVRDERVPRDVRTQLLAAALVSYLLGVLALRLPLSALARKKQRPAPAVE